MDNTIKKIQECIDELRKVEVKIVRIERTTRYLKDIFNK
jgi:hypothetical protein